MRKRDTKVVYGKVENPGNGNEYIALYDNVDDMFEDDCDGQEILVFKLSHRAVASRKTSTKVTLSKAKK